MRVRVTAGVGAWIVGAATATGLSLVAVSYLTQDPQSPQGTALSQTEVNEALASMTGTAGSATPPGASTPANSGTPQPTPSAPASPTESNAATGPTVTAPPQNTAPAAPRNSTTATAQPVERTLSGAAGTVVAQCQGSTVYLVTWTPAQGYQARALQRGPARLATLVFTGYGHDVDFHIGCPGGAPGLVGGDDGGGDDH